MEVGGGPAIWPISLHAHIDHDTSRSLIVPEQNRAVQAIGEHIRTGGAVVGGGVPVRADKPSHFRVIVPAGDVVQLRLAVVVIAPVAEGVAGGKIGVVTAGGQDIAVIVAGVGESIEGAAFDIVPEGKTLRYILLNNHVKGEKPQNNYGNKCNLRNTQFPRLCL